MEGQTNLRGRSGAVSTLAVAVLLVVALGWAFLFVRDSIPTRAYQAVFLSNNQVYFGKMSGKSSEYIRLTDIYYLQLRQPLQNQQRGEGQNTAPDLTLIKLGNELHGPTDRMEINQDQVVFIEELKDDSRVVQAIKNYQAQQ